ncbi:MAG: hypothetical protein P2A85_16925 [Microcoleus anatoxicus]|uniref:hypothetical protein n=1 Tax=Microcoleus anatoxicus TaxID=2705319 RepID=UPI00366F1DB1
MNCKKGDRTKFRIFIQDLPTPTKETGFLLNLWVAMKYFRKKPGFWESAQFARYL